MENQYHLEYVVNHGGSSRAPERFSDSPNLRAGLLALLELPLQRYFLEKTSLRLIVRQRTSKVPTLQRKTEAGIRTLELTQAPEHATMACFFVPAYQWWLRQGTFTVAGSFGSGCSNPVWATAPEIRTSRGSDFNPKRLPA